MKIKQFGDRKKKIIINILGRTLLLHRYHENLIQRTYVLYKIDY